MDYLKKLKGKSIRKTLFPFLLLLIAGGVLLYISEVWLNVIQPVNLYDVPAEHLEGKYVTVEVPFIYDSFCYTEQYKDNVATGRITSKEYVIDANAEDYCALYLPESLVKKGDALMRESQKVFDYEMEVEDITKSFTVSGKVEKMEGKTLRYYEDVYENLDGETQALFLPLEIKARGSVDVIQGWAFGAAGLACIIWALCLMIRAAAGKGQKQLLAKAEALAPGNPEYILNQVQELCSASKGVGGLRMNDNIIFIELGSKQYLYTTGDLCWAYKNTVTHRTNGIKTGTTYNLMMMFRDRSSRAVSMTEAQVDEHLQRIFAQLPGCVVGYSKELEKQYKTDLNAFAQIAAAQRAPKQEAQTETEPQA